VGGGCGGGNRREKRIAVVRQQQENATLYTAPNEIYEDKTINIIREAYCIGNSIIGTTRIVTAGHRYIPIIYL